ncbi:MAG: hypothetical protein JXB07_14240 [Anaerolineae bacterium]|nr:hypothetical protein [Anaerolineae bacterium]
MDTITELKRWGLLLDTLSQISDLERQLVIQGEHPTAFVPDELLDQWGSLFQGGRGLQTIGLSESMLSVLVDFDFHMRQFINALPETTANKEDYIRNDEAWRTIREMADLTLTRIALISIPDQPLFSEN